MTDQHDNFPGLGSDYIEPADRPTAWAAMAADLNADGCTHAEIAMALCVDETTVSRLLKLAGSTS